MANKIRATRIEAMKWWNNLNGSIRQQWSEKYYPNRKHQSLTGFEIQSIYERKRY